ncbi:MAG TPA: hypothetical protein VNK91_02045 [Burkholderiaceae bacterium]|nr:hypothetical protein [Burkholderiaceae bacterium]
MTNDKPITHRCCDAFSAALEIGSDNKWASQRSHWNERPRRQGNQGAEK